MSEKWIKQIGHFFLIPAVVGCGGGFSAVVFRKAISLFHSALVNVGHIISCKVNWLYPIVIPLSFLLTNLISKIFSVSSENVTIDEISKKISLRKGGFNPKKGLIILGITSLNIGAGIPVGREGPIAKLGGVISETFLKFIRIDKLHSPIYLTCGISSAISATFNAPIAGILFGIEIILGKINNYILIPIIVSSSVAAIISQEVFGDFAAFKVPKLTFNNEDFLFLPIVVLILSLIPTFFWIFYKFLVNLKYTLRHSWKKLTLIYGTAVGTVLLFFPQAAGVGYNQITLLLEGKIPPFTSFEIFLAKFFAVVTSFGAGIFGGLMSPSIFLGAFGGYSIGELISSINPKINPSVFALIGAASVLSGISKAPFRSSLIIIELTHSYQLIVPILLSSVITKYIVTLEEEISFLKRTLFSRGIDVEDINTSSKFSHFKIEKFLKKIPPLPQNLSTVIAKKKLLNSSFKYIPVIASSKNPKLVGILSLRDLRLTPTEQIFHLKVKDIMTENPFILTLKSTPQEVLKAIALLDVNLIPVTDEKGNYVGMFNVDEFLRFLSE